MSMLVGDLVRIGAAGTLQFRVVEVKGPTPISWLRSTRHGLYEFSMRLVDLTWTD